MKQGLISLFSGAGGLDLGFEQAGFITKVAYDIYPPAIETYNRSQKRNIAKLADLHVLDVDEVISDINSLEKPIPPVGVIGGPPCQAFSHSNVYPREEFALPGV